MPCRTGRARYKRPDQGIWTQAAADDALRAFIVNFHVGWCVWEVLPFPRFRFRPETGCLRLDP